MVSPANTYVGLTHSGPGTAAGEPGKYYPTGKRNYARVVAADDFQGAADATLAKKLGVKKLFILNDKEAYGLGVATNTKNAAKKLGIKTVGFTAWDGKATSYSALALKIKQSGAQAVFLGGLICENGGKLIKDIRAGAPKVKIIDAGRVHAGLGRRPAVVGQGRGHVRLGRRPPERAAAGRRQGVREGVLALERWRRAGPVLGVRRAGRRRCSSTRSRSPTAPASSVADQLFKVRIPSGILGPITFNTNGDVTANPVTIYLVKGGKPTTYQVIVPAPSLVASA